MKPTFLLVVVAALTLPACSLQSIALRSMDGILNNEMTAIMEEQDLILAEQSVTGSLKLLDGLVKTDPENEHLLLMACQGYTSYTLAFAEDSADRAQMLYTRAQGYGMRGLKLRGVPDSAFHAGADAMRAALAKLSRDDVPMVFWTVNAWASATNLQLNNPDALANLPTINAMMSWVVEQDSTYFYGGPLMYFGIYYGTIPVMFGGNPELSRSYFDRAASVNGGKFLMTQIFYAKTYAVQTQNETLYKALLKHVLDAPLEDLPEQRLSNVVAKTRARHMLEHAADFF